MKVVGGNQIDYWQGVYATRRGLKSRFGIRVQAGRRWALVQLGNDEARTFGNPHEIPVDLTTLPSYMRMILDDHQLNYVKSDLVEILTGKKSLREALGLPDKMGVKRAAASGTVRLPNAS